MGADKVKFVRMKLYLSQAQLAKEIDVSFAADNRGRKVRDMSRNLHPLGDLTTSAKSTVLYLIIQMTLRHRQEL